MLFLILLFSPFLSAFVVAASIRSARFINPCATSLDDQFRFKKTNLLAFGVNLGFFRLALCLGSRVARSLVGPRAVLLLLFYFIFSSLVFTGLRYRIILNTCLGPAGGGGGIGTTLRVYDKCPTRGGRVLANQSAAFEPCSVLVYDVKVPSPQL